MYRRSGWRAWPTASRTRASRLKAPSKLQSSRAARTCRTSAQFLSKSIAQEIELRWRILEAEAASPKLRELMLDTNRGLIENQTLDPQQRTAVQSWLDKRYIANSSSARATSWFINAIEGTQVARVPEAPSIGRNYRHRDYFHGRGRGPSAEQPGDKRVDSVARSDCAHVGSLREHQHATLMVAFSVPIWSDSAEESSRKPIGILAMAVELGDFAIGRHAVLADTRVDQIQSRRGLILHHPRLGLKSSDEALPRLSDAVVESAMLLARPEALQYDPDPDGIHYSGGFR